MPHFVIQQDLDVVAQNLDASSASQHPTTATKVRNITEAQAREQINAPIPKYTPPIHVEYRLWELRNPLHQSWPPIKLFLLFFQPILDLIIFHTNIHAHRNNKAKQPWKDVIEIEIRRWIACRMELWTHNGAIPKFWQKGTLSTKAIGITRFLAIERHICVETRPEPEAIPGQLPPQFWLVLDAMNRLRARLSEVLIPGSHIVVDESAIKFHGRKVDKYRLPHKPAKEGFVVYTLASHGGLAHDFFLSSSQAGPEGGREYIELDIPTRTLRKRKRGQSGDTATVVKLPPIKALVYTLCERVTALFRHQPFICFVDNLFVDVPLARALLTINIGICGTTRKNTPGIPPVLQAIQHRFPKLLPKNQLTTAIVSDLVNITTWHDGLRDNIVSFITTVHRPQSYKPVLRSAAPLNATRTTPCGFAHQWITQPAVAVDYNDFMNAVDHFNHLRYEGSVRRAGQVKWTKKFIEFAIDLARVNAYIIWSRYHPDTERSHRNRELFTQLLVDGLLDWQEEVHIPNKRPNRTHCAWRGCYARQHSPTQPLQEVHNSAYPYHSRKTYYYCDKCSKALCVDYDCWTAYHEA